jgi:hypothetical protein
MRDRKKPGGPPYRAALLASGEAILFKNDTAAAPFAFHCQPNPAGSAEAALEGAEQSTQPFP